jgi:hypothetical protein
VEARGKKHSAAAIARNAWKTSVVLHALWRVRSAATALETPQMHNRRGSARRH